MMKFTSTHEWIALHEGIGIVGITNYAQRELGEIVYVELPSLGKAVAAGDEIAVLESTKAAADMYVPVSGEIIEINEQLRQDPALINQAAESKGWLFKVKLSKISEMEQLLDQHQYEELVK